MNKDVIYIEPEDDITDILTSVKEAQAKIVALVPPKKANVLKSAVNFKLLARTARAAGKAVVLVTTDSALLKLAATTGIPVARSLQSKPEVPINVAVEESPEVGNEVIDGDEAIAVVKEEKKMSPAEQDEEAVVESIKLDDEDKPDPDEAKGRKSARKAGSLGSKIKKFRKFIVVGAVGVVLIVGFLVWALVLAPSAKIAIAVRTVPRQFSETISFTTDEKKQDPGGGIFLLELHKITKQSSVEFDATGEVDKGDKATGTLTLKRPSAVNTSQMDAITIAKGTQFTRNGLTYVTTEAGTLPAIDNSNHNCTGPFGNQTCTLTKEISVTIKVEAMGPSEKYNIDAHSSGWTPTNSRYSIASSAMTGGTSKLVKVVSAADITRAREKLESVSTADGKAELIRSFPVGLIVIADSFKTVTDDPVATPAIGEEVSEEVIPKLVAKTTFSMYGVDRVRVAEYVEARTRQAISSEKDQTVYSTGVSDDVDNNKAFIELFREVDGSFSAKLKTVTRVGPEVTDQMVIDKSLGRKIGEVQSLLKSINGISKVEVNTSYVWVTSIPNDINKVSVEITVE